MHAAPQNMPSPSDPMQPDSKKRVLTTEQVAQFARRRQKLTEGASRQRLHALIVEDQAFSRNLLDQVLQRNCTVSSCTNVKDGWKLYLDEIPDIVFLDIGLPDASGHVLADKIKELDPLSYIIMVTASQDFHDVQEAKVNGVDGFIIKPFNVQKIGDCITHYLVTQKGGKHE